MKFSFFTVLITVIIFTSCQAPAEKQYFTESPEIDLGKKVIEAYLSGNFDAYGEYYSDTVSIFRNAWDDEAAMSLEDNIADLQSNLEPIASYDMDPQIWEMVVTDEGEHWVHLGTVCSGNNEATGKEYDIVVHASMLVVDNKIVMQADIYNDTEITLDMMALAEEMEEEEGDHGEEDVDE